MPSHNKQSNKYLLILITTITLSIGILLISKINNTKAQTDTTPPTTPTNLTTTTPPTGGSSQINLTWTASTDDTAVTGYNIYRCTGSSCTPTTSIGTSSTNSYSDTGLTAESTYTYAISAYDAVPNTSGNSTAVSGTTEVSGIPTISSVIGSISNGETIMIEGGGFGVKITGTPLRYDNFKSGTVDQVVPNTLSTGGWYTEAFAYTPTYTDKELRHSDTMSIVQTYNPSSGANIGLDNRKYAGAIPVGTQELYVSGWFRFEMWDGLSNNVKFINMGTGIDAGWQTRIDTYPNPNGKGHLYANLSDDCTATGTNGTYNYVHDYNADVENVMKPDDKWHRVETYLRIGETGYRDVHIDSVKIGEISGRFTGIPVVLAIFLSGTILT